MSENEMLEKNETIKETVSEKLETAKEAAEETADKTLEELEAENEKLRRELELMKEKTIKERIYDHVRTMDIFIGVMVVLFVVVVVMGMLNK